MLFLKFLTFSALSVQPMTTLAKWRGEASCAWNPSSNLLGPPICGLDQGSSSPTIQQNRTDNEGTTDLGWRGPHECFRSFCLYSNPEYSGGRGLVVITEKRFMRSLANMFHEPETDISDAYRVKKIPRKGLGVVADRQIERGEAVMPFPPVFVVLKEVLYRGYQPERYLDLLARGVNYLPQHTKKQFLGLMAHPCGHHIKDIFMTNGYHVIVNSGIGWGKHTGIYPELSRINHDCRPNIAYHIGDNLIFRGNVVRPIAPGEELTTSYLDPFQKWELRQEKTNMSWGFKCECTHCALPKVLREESDKRLDRMEELQTKLISTDTNITMDDVREFVHRFEEERLDIKMANALVIAARSANAMGYEKEAKEYAAKAIEASLFELGPESSDSWDMRELIEDAQRHRTLMNRFRRSKFRSWNQ